MTITEHLIGDRYQMKEKLGEGGMGVVFRAYDSKTKADVAIKALRETSDDAGMQLFATEWHILAGLAHPNIVDIRDVGEIVEQQGRRPYFVMPLLRGRTLAVIMEESRQPLPPARLVEIMRQVCRGLQAAHEHGLIHRDLKPSNIFVMEDDTAKLIDFGVAHVAGINSISGYKGTWQYMSPEQVNLGPAIIESDIFALGIICYEALTGIRPFARANVSETASAVRRHIPRPIHEVNSAVCEALSLTIHRAMAKEPRQRFASAREFSETLTRSFSPVTLQPADKTNLQARLDRARQAFVDGDLEFAAEIVWHLRADGYLTADVNDLHEQIERSLRRTKIAQLLAEARVRLQAGELELAIRKVHEALGFDPNDVNALALRGVLEDRRMDQIVMTRRRAAQEHLQGRDYEKARAELLDLLAGRPYDQEAILLLAEIEVRLQEAQRARAECDICYDNAQRAYELGEFDTALDEIGQAIDLLNDNPDVSYPRESLFRELKDKIVCEQQEIDEIRDEIRQKTADRDYVSALELCNRALSRYPGHDKFTALQLEIGRSQARDFSQYLAETCAAAEANANPKTRATIWARACERHPGHAFFHEQHQLALTECDLTQLLVSKAQQYRDRGQFFEALLVWEIVRSIYPEWPGLESEIFLAQASHERAARRKKQSAIVRSCRGALETGAFERAAEQAREGLAVFPGDAELHELKLSASISADNAAEASRLFTDGLSCLARGDVDGGISALEAAYSLGPTRIPVRSMLLNALDRKLDRLEKNSEEAESIRQRMAAVEAQGGPIPLSLRAGVRRSTPDSGRNHGATAPAPDPAPPKRISDSSVDSSTDDTAPFPSVSPERPVERSFEPKPRIFRIENVAHIRSVVKSGLGRLRPISFGPSRRGLWIAAAIAAAALLIVGVYAARNRRPRTKHTVPPQQQALVSVRIITDPVDAAVAVDGKVLGSRSISVRADQQYDVSVSSQGYQAVAVHQAGSSRNWNFVLRPLPLHIRVFTAEQRGRLLLDGQVAGSLQNGDIQDYEFARDGHEHSLMLKTGKGDAFALRFQAPANAAAAVSQVANKDLLVVSSLGATATVYSGEPSNRISFDNRPPQPVPTAGLVLTGVTPGKNRLDINGAQKQSVGIELNDAPVLLVYFRMKTDTGYLSVKTEAPGAILRLDGADVPARQPGQWVIARPAGTYAMLITAEGYQDRLETVTVTAGMYSSRAFEMQPKPNLGTLRFLGATPGASVFIDHNPAGTVAATGYWESNTMTQGVHTIELRKPNYETLTREINFTGTDRNLAIEGPAVTMIELGMLDFRIPHPLAQVRYRRIDEREEHTTGPNGGIRVQPGKYEVRVNGPGFEPVTRIYEVAAGQTVPVALAPNMAVARPAAPAAPSPLPAVLFEDPGVVEHEGNWLRLKERSTAILKTPPPDLNLVLIKPAKGFWKAKKMELSVHCKNGDTVTYELERSKLTRRSVLRGKSDLPVTLPQSPAADAPVSVVLHLQSGHLILNSADGAQIDAIDAPGADFAAAKIAIKGDSLFLVRPQ